MQEYEYIGISETYMSRFNHTLAEHVKLGWEPFGSIATSGQYYFSILLRRKISRES
jgi:hypothetical protein